MPYPGEFAKHSSIRRLANSPLVQGLQDRCRICLPEDEADLESQRASLITDVPRTDWLPAWIIAIDGSHVEVPVRNGFPGAEISYLSVASVMINVERMRVLDEQRPVDPYSFNRLQETDAIDCALPGCNVVIDNDSSALESFRKQLFTTFSQSRMTADGESILDTFEALLEYKPVSDQKCPNDDCPKQPPTYDLGQGAYNCTCDLARSLFSTDSLRIHEGMNPAGSNGAMFAEVSQVLEHVWLINILRTMEQKGWLSSLKRICFVIDGPLAIFGHPAWLSESINKELGRLNAVARATNGIDLLILGVEKTGFFLEHLFQLDVAQGRLVGPLSNQTTMLLTDAYIKRNIVFSESNKPYGSQTYYGRKFLYKTATGARIVGVLPFLNNGDEDLSRAETSQYPRLSDALNILDELVSVRYPNAILPIIAAHAEAAIPLNTGSRVLEQIARELLGA